MHFLYLPTRSHVSTQAAGAGVAASAAGHPREQARDRVQGCVAVHDPAADGSPAAPAPLNRAGGGRNSGARPTARRTPQGARRMRGMLADPREIRIGLPE